MRITVTDFDVSRESLSRPFAFKGGAFTEKWLTVSGGETSSGARAVGLGSLAVLWSDPSLFSSHSESGGNLVMALIAEEALRLLRDRDYADPVEATRSVFPGVYEYARRITGMEALRQTVALNSLISADNLLWLLHAQELGVCSFDAMIPSRYGSVLGDRQDRLVCLPAVTYTFPVQELVSRAEGGDLLPKIKIGQPGSPQEMLARDCARLSEIHAALSGGKAGYSDSGGILYYLDANGRYDSPETLLRLLDFLDHIGMLEDVLLVEEPFAEEATFEVGDLPVSVAADECLHGVDDIVRRISMGYDIMTLKAAGKTLSMSLEMALAAVSRGMPCIVADSCCVPLLLGWNMNLAACLPSLPGLRCGILESNGADSYRDWAGMLAAHPCSGAGWLEATGGVFALDQDFYACSGGIFESVEPYASRIQLVR